MKSVDVPEWVQDAVFYQIFPDRFARSESVFKPTNMQPWGAQPTTQGFQGGDLIGVVEKLDYLVDLGVNALYFNPIFASASNHRYHTHDYYRVDPILGGQPAFEKLVAAAHGRGIRIVLDGVFNHASRGFYQFNHLLECGDQSPYADWFRVESWPLNAYDESQPPNYDAWWGKHALPEFNTDHPQVREYLWDVAVHWLRQGIDGWRLDVPNEIDDDDFWREFRHRCRQASPDCYIVGELWHDAQRWLQGDQFDAQMNYLFTRAAFGFCVGHRMDQSDTASTGYGWIRELDGVAFATEMDRLNNHLYDPSIVRAQMNMLGSHDTPRMMTIARGDEGAVRLMLLCQMTMPGAPNIYYGDEIGMIGAHDPDCRRAFPWEDHASWNYTLLDATRQFIQLRHRTPALRRGAFKILHASGDAVVYMRRYQDNVALVGINAGTQESTVSVTLPAETRLENALSPDSQPLSGSAVELAIPARDGTVWTGDIIR